MISLIALVSLVPPAAGGQFGIGLFKGSKGDFKNFSDPAGRFQLEYPKDWQPTTGIGDLLFTFAQKNREAALIVERFHLDQAPGEIGDLFGQIELDLLKGRQSQVTDAAVKIAASNGIPVVVIDYSRPGLAGSERARQYSFPIGQDVYRLNCSALASLFAKYDPIFVRIASSFMAGTATATGAPPAGSGAAQTRPK